MRLTNKIKSDNNHAIVIDDWYTPEEYQYVLQECKFISSYFKDHFVIYGLPEESILSFVGWEYKQDKTHLYASFDYVPNVSVLKWSNSFLMATFPEQKNIVILSTSTTKKSFLHTKEVNYAQFNF